MEAIRNSVNLYTSKLLGSETERKIGLFLFDDKVVWSNSRELNGLAALTFNDYECYVVYAMLRNAMEPSNNTHSTILKAVNLMKHFVVYGAERCVDHTRQAKNQLEELVPYNSAIHSRTGALVGSGIDYGGPVREAVRDLIALISDTDKIRHERSKVKDENSLLPLGSLDDFFAPSEKKDPIQLAKSSNDTFGLLQTNSLGAKYDLSAVPGMYDGRPDRYFDNLKDSRNSNRVEDASITRNFLAKDLLDLDIQAENNIEPSKLYTQDLVSLKKQSELEKQLDSQRKQLEALKQAMLMQQKQQPYIQQPQVYGYAGNLNSSVHASSLNHNSNQNHHQEIMGMGTQNLNGYTNYMNGSVQPTGMIPNSYPKMQEVMGMNVQNLNSYSGNSRSSVQPTGMIHSSYPSMQEVMGMGNQNPNEYTRIMYNSAPYSDLNHQLATAQNLNGYPNSMYSSVQQTGLIHSSNTSQQQMMGMGNRNLNGHSSNMNSLVQPTGLTQSSSANQQQIMGIDIKNISGYDNSINGSVHNKQYSS